MADISEKNASGSTKIVGSDSNGNETNYVDITDSGGLKTEAILASTPQLDAFGRLRVSNPTAIFEYNFIYDVSFDTYWDTDLTNGATITHDSDKSSRELSVTSTSGSKAILQSRRHIEYYTGQSNLYYFTTNPNGVAANIQKRLGVFDENNGYFFEANGNTGVGVVIRSKTSGSVVDTKILQADWNTDKLDGNGPSGLTGTFLTQVLLWMDVAWLGSGGVRFGIVYNGKHYVLHESYQSAVITTPFCQSNILPFRFEVENLGGGAADSAFVTCCSVKVEGTKSDVGRVRSGDTGTSEISFNNTEDFGFALRINPSYPYASVKALAFSLLAASGSNDAIYRIYFNPTLTSPTWASNPDSITQSVTNTPNFSGGLVIESGHINLSSSARSQISNILDSDIYLGMSIDGTPDILMITLETAGGSGSAFFAGQWREYT